MTYYTFEIVVGKEDAVIALLLTKLPHHLATFLNGQGIPRVRRGIYRLHTEGCIIY